MRQSWLKLENTRWTSVTPPSSLLSPLQMLLLSLNLTHPRLSVYSAIHTIQGGIHRLMHFVWRPICWLFNTLYTGLPLKPFCSVYNESLHIKICNGVRQHHLLLIHNMLPTVKCDHHRSSYSNTRIMSNSRWWCQFTNLFFSFLALYKNQLSAGVLSFLFTLTLTLTLKSIYLQ